MGILYPQVKSAGDPNNYVNGQLLSTPARSEEVAVPNQAGLQAEVYTYLVSGAADQDYTITMEGESVTFTRASGETAAQIAAELETLWKENFVLYGLADISLNTATLTITKRSKALSAAVTSHAGGANVTITKTQSNDDVGTAASIGRAVFIDSNGSGTQSLASSVATSRVLTVTAAGATNNAVYGAVLTHDGQSYSWEYTADGTATTAEILQDLETFLNGLGLNLTIAETDPTLTITGLRGHTDFDLAITSGNDELTVAVTTAGVDITEALVGIQRHNHQHASSSRYSSSLAVNPPHAFLAVCKGDMIIDSGSGASGGDSVYLGTSGTEEGAFYAAASTTRIKLPRESFRWFGQYKLQFDHMPPL